MAQKEDYHEQIHLDGTHTDGHTSFIFAQGSNYKLGTTIRITQSDTVSNNVMAAGRFVDIFGHLNDDLCSASRNLVINGSVGDDAIAVAQSVTIRGTIGDMLVTAGETVVIDGEISGDLFAAGSEIRLTKNALIGGNAALAAGTLLIEGGQINGWARLAGSEINLNGSVGRYVEIYSNNISFGDNYSPSSSTNITTTRELSREDFANAPEELTIVVEEAEETWASALLFSTWLYVAVLIIGFLTISLFRQTTTDLYRYSHERYFKNTGIGLLLFLGIPIAIIVLFILVLTIPLSVITMMIYALALLFGFLLVAVSLGTGVLRYFRTEDKFADYYWGLALGMILILLLIALPYIGPFINLILIFFGLGTLTSYFWQMRNNSM